MCKIYVQGYRRESDGFQKKSTRYIKPWNKLILNFQLEMDLFLKN